MRSNIALALSALALLVSLAVGQLTLARYYDPVADSVHAVSIWSDDVEHGVTLWYLGIIPIASCYAAGNSVDEMKRWCTGGRFRAT